MSRREFLSAAALGTAGTGVALALAGCGGTHATHRGGQDADVDAGPGPYRSEPGLHPPEILLDRRPADPGGDAFVMTDAHGGHGQQGPMIIDRSGRLRWFHPVSDHGSRKRRVMNVRVQRYRGRRVLSYWIGALEDSHGAGHYEIYDERYRQIATVHAGDGLRGDLHEFLITPQGTALLTAYGEARGELPTPDGTGSRCGPYFYCCCQEIDIATGRLLLNWRSDEHAPLSDSRLGLPHRRDFPWDYFHMNSINIDPSDGNLIVSSRNLWQVYKIDRRSGATIWRLGGTGSDFELEDRAVFAFQHDVTPHAHGIYTMFDNEGGPPNEASQSRGLVVKVDEGLRTVTFLREYHHAPPVLSQALGSFQTLTHGGAFIGWGNASYFTEWNDAGEVVLDGRLSGVKSYRAFQQPWRGVPATPPKFAVARRGRRATLYVSWNGATVHRDWRVLGGTRSGALSELTRVGVDGFETKIELARAPTWVMVEAVGEHGDVVGRSDALKLSA